MCYIELVENSSALNPSPVALYTTNRSEALTLMLFLFSVWPRGVSCWALRRSHMSHDMTKPRKWVCAQRRQISLGIRHWTVQRRLIRLGGCLGWSEVSLGAHSFCWFCDVVIHLFSVLCSILITSLVTESWSICFYMVYMIFVHLFYLHSVLFLFLLVSRFSCVL